MPRKSKAPLPKPDGNRGRGASNYRLYVAIFTAFLQDLKRLVLWFGCRDIFPGVIEIVIRKGGMRDV